MAKQIKPSSVPALPEGYYRSRHVALGAAIVARVKERGDMGEAIDALHRYFAAAFPPCDINAAVDAIASLGLVCFTYCGPQVRVVMPRQEEE